jgi:hypothetical protein
MTVFLSAPPATAATDLPALVDPRKGDGCDTIVLNHRRRDLCRALGPHHQHGQNRSRQARRIRDIGEGKPTAGRRGGMLEQDHVARRQRWGESSYDLPVRRIPGHDGEHDAERLRNDLAAKRVGFEDLRLK